MTLGSHQQTIGKSQVHLTPRWIIEAVGPFDTDPCASDPRPWDCAAVNYTKADDGLTQDWKGTVWLNPPFDRREVGRWMNRLADHGDGIALLHARTETDWFGVAWRRAAGMLFMSKRIVFCDTDGGPSKSKDGNVFNSGAPPVLVAFGATALQRLRDSGLKGNLVTGWERLAPMLGWLAALALAAHAMVGRWS